MYLRTRIPEPVVDELIDVPGTQGSTKPEYYSEIEKSHLRRIIAYWKKQPAANEAPNSLRIRWLEDRL